MPVDYLTAVRKRWRWVAACLLLSVAGAVAANHLLPRRYTSSVVFFVSTQGLAGPDTGASSAYQGSLFSQERVKSYAQLVTSRSTAEAIRDDMGGTPPVADLQRALSASPVAGTVLLRASVEDRSAGRALAIAQSLAREVPGLVQQLEDPDRTGRSPVQLTVLEAPQLATAPTSPRPVRNFALAGVLGLLAGLVLAALREQRDDTLRSAEELRASVTAPVLSSIPDDRQARKSPLVLKAAGLSARGEAFRRLRTNLRFLDAASPVRALLFTSASAQEGKSSTSCNLAISLAESGARVVLVDADLRNPQLGNYLGLEAAVGLTDVLVGQASLHTVLQPWGQGLLELLPAGPVPPNPSELLGSQRMVDLLRVLAERCDMVIIDTPPVVPFTDAAVLATFVDGAVVVVEHARTTRSQARDAAEAIRAAGGRVIGAVVNRAPSPAKVPGYYAARAEVQQTLPEPAGTGEARSQTADPVGPVDDYVDVSDDPSDDDGSARGTPAPPARAREAMPLASPTPPTGMRDLPDGGGPPQIW